MKWKAVSLDGLTEQTLQVHIRKLNYKTGKLTPCMEQSVSAVALEGNGVFEDSYFSLLPGQRRTITFTAS